MRNSESSIYTSIVNTKNSYRQATIAAGQIFTVFHTVTVPIMFGSYFKPDVKTGIAIVGTFVSAAFLFWMSKQFRRSRYLYEKLAELEALDEGLEDAPRVVVFNTNRFKSSINRKFSLETFSLISICICIILWFTTFVWLAGELLRI